MNRKGADQDEDGPSAEERNVREVVETSLATEDLTPLVGSFPPPTASTQPGSHMHLLQHSNAYPCVS